MSALLETIAWNSVAALALAFFVLVAGRVWNRPELLHVFWLVVLIKLVTPAVIRWEALPDVIGTHPAPLTPQTAGTLPLAEIPAASPVVMAADPYRWVELSAAVWIAGSALFLVVVLLQCVRFARALRVASPAARALGKRIEGLARRIGVAAPRTLVLDATVPPMVWGGLRRSTLVLPSRLMGRLTADETDTLITHELAHVKRRDPWIRWIELAVTTALWWNPLVWWVRRRLRHVEEQACDRRVLEMFPRAQRTYADGIVKTVEFLAGHDRTPQFATGAAGTRPIKERLTMILNPSSKNRLRHPLVPAILLALLALPIVPGFAERDDRKDEKVRAELLELEREALELEHRLQEIQAERNAIRMRLGETRRSAEAADARREVEELHRRGEFDEAARREAKLEKMEQERAEHEALRAEMLEREHAMQEAALEIREAKEAYARARAADDLAAYEDYARALADGERSQRDRAVAMEDAERVYRRALEAQQQEQVAKKLDQMADEYRRLREADRDADAEELARMMEELRSERVERDYRGEKDVAGDRVRAQLEELKIVLETADDEDRTALEHKIQVLTEKLHELERRERPNGVR